MANYGKRKSKRFITIKGRDLTGRDAMTATEAAFADRFARIERNRKRDAIEAKEAMS